MPSKKSAAIVDHLAQLTDPRRLEPISLGGQHHVPPTKGEDMHLSTLTKSLTFALLALAATAAQAQTRIFQIKVVNSFDREISIDAKAGNHNYEGQQKKMAIQKGQSELVTLAFNNRSSIGWHDGHVNLHFEDANTMGTGFFQILFDRGGRVYQVDLKRPTGESAICRRDGNGWFSERIEKKQVGKINVKFSGPTKWRSGYAASGYDGSDHYYTLELSSVLTPVVQNVNLIIGYQDGPEKVTEYQSETRQQEETYRKVMKSSWSVSSTVEASLGGVSGSVTGSAAGSQGTTSGNTSGSQSANTKTKVVELKFGQMRFTVVPGDILKNEVTGEFRFRPSGIYDSSVFTKEKGQLKNLNGYYSVDGAVPATGLKLERLLNSGFMKVVGN